MNDAYGDPDGSDVGGAGPTNMLEVVVNRVAISPALVNRQQVTEERRGQSSFVVDPADYAFLDDHILFVRVQERRAPAGWLAIDALAVHNPNMPLLGPIMPVPPVSFFGQSAGYLTLAGTAP